MQTLFSSVMGKGTTRYCHMQHIFVHKKDFQKWRPVLHVDDQLEQTPTVRELLHQQNATQEGPSTSAGKFIER